MSSLVSIIFFLLFLHFTSIFSARPTTEISKAIKWTLKSESEPESCKTGNPIDDCWRCDPEWGSNRKTLADCAVGFGHNAIGGRDGEIYTVTDPGDDPENPTPGTLRYAVVRSEPLWIIFGYDMVINLKEDLRMSSYKTIDGRGFDIRISSGPCITIRNVSNIIIHNIYIHDCLPSGYSTVLGGNSDGDGISIYASRDVWIDHCTLANCYDGLIDVVYGSTAITISNNYMLKHNEVMLMGHSDDFLPDKDMQVTIAFNYFGEALVQRMPRCRHGYFHIVNNIYNGWGMYAIGGSANPTINSQGNLFIASPDEATKEVTKRENVVGSPEWKEWNWRSEGDMMWNGAFFTPSGQEDPASYTKASSMIARPASLLTTIAPSTGALTCHIGYKC